jgi:hypothetical protein
VPSGASIAKAGQVIDPVCGSDHGIVCHGCDENIEHGFIDFAFGISGDEVTSAIHHMMF